MGLFASVAGILVIQLALVCWFDLKYGIIPNVLNISIAITGLAIGQLVAAMPALLGLLKIVSIYAFFWVVALAYRAGRGQSGLGGGDIKFLAAASAWIDLQTLPWLVLVSCVSGLAVAIFAAWRGSRLSAERRIPFGPHLALGLFAVWLATNRLGV